MEGEKNKRGAVENRIYSGRGDFGDGECVGCGGGRGS